MRNFLIKNRVLLLHLSFWVLYFSYRFYDIQKYFGVHKTLIYLSIPLAFNIATSYLHYFLIFPQWLKSKNTLSYSVRLALLIAAVITLRFITEHHVYASIITREDYYQTITLARIISTMWDTLTFVIFTGMIRFMVDWFDFESKKKQLENEKLIAELNFLKAQINPHFLFNTLHNLNYLVYSGSSKATDVIIKLSNIMRYMIYDANKEFVPLKKEIAYMKDYIDLESIRLNHPFKMDFDIKANSEQTQVAPLVMLTFLENAFKHGISDQQENCWIKLKLIADSNIIQYEVSNSKLKNPSKSLRSGFGLTNVKKRLALSYPDKHKLSIKDNETEYHVQLTLQLT